MNKPVPPPTPPAELARPQVRLNGPVDDSMLREFLDQLQAAEADGGGGLVVELTTPGGDPDVARRIAGDLRLFGQRTGRRVTVLGKSVVYSAGVAVLASVPRERRWLAHEAVLLVHCRSLSRTVEFGGPLLMERARVEALLAEIDMGLKLETEDFERLVAGSTVGMAELQERAVAGWWLDAAEALERGLVAGVV